MATCESGTSKRDQDGATVVMVQDGPVMDVDEATEEVVQVTAVVCEGGIIEEAT